jgi:hypothetical protein
MQGRNRKQQNRYGGSGRALLFILALIGATAMAAEKPAWTPAHLMQALSEVDQRQTRFVETRELSLLQQALTSRGSLTFQRPDHLVKSFDPPMGLSYEIEADRLLIRKPDGSEEIVRLDNAPQLQAYVAAMRAVLAGDLAQLERYFEPRLDGERERWRLRLIPKAPSLSRQVEAVEIEGSDTTIHRFLIFEQGGDRIVTRLLPSDAE